MGHRLRIYRERGCMLGRASLAATLCRQNPAPDHHRSRLDLQRPCSDSGCSRQKQDHTADLVPGSREHRLRGTWPWWKGGAHAGGFQAMSYVIQSRRETEKAELSLCSSSSVGRALQGNIRTRPMDLNQIESRPEFKLTLTSQQLTATEGNGERRKREERVLFELIRLPKRWMVHHPAGP
jgi:hypothetical protein